MTLKQERLAGKESLADELDQCPNIMFARIVAPADRQPEYVISGSLRDRISAALRPDRTEPASASSELETRLREYRSRDEWGEQIIRHTICDEAADTLATLHNDLGEAFEALTRISDCSDDEQVSRVAKEAADKIEGALTTNQDTPDAG